MAKAKMVKISDVTQYEIASSIIENSGLNQEVKALYDKKSIEGTKLYDLLVPKEFIDSQITILNTDSKNIFVRMSDTINLELIAGDNLSEKSSTAFYKFTDTYSANAWKVRAFILSEFKILPLHSSITLVVHDNLNIFISGRDTGLTLKSEEVVNFYKASKEYLSKANELDSLERQVRNRVEKYRHFERLFEDWVEVKELLTPLYEQAKTEQIKVKETKQNERTVLPDIEVMNKGLGGIIVPKSDKE
jgi:hypothetical protein